MPGMPGTRKMPGMPGLDTYNWEVPRSRSMPRSNGSAPIQSARQPPLIGKTPTLNSKFLPQGSGGIVAGKTSALLQGGGTPVEPSSLSGIKPVTQNPRPVASAAASVVPSPEKPMAPAAGSIPVNFHRKTVSLLEEYFSVRMLDEALQCVEELKAPAYHSEVVKEAIFLALEKSPPCVEPVIKLLEYLLNKNVLAARDIGTGCLLYGSMLDDIGIDLPKAPNNFGEVLGQLVLAGGLDFKVVKEVLKKVEDDSFQTVIFGAAMRIINSSPSGQQLVAVQGADIQDCERRIIPARSIFDKIPTKDTVSWNSIILAYTNAGDMVEAQKLFNEMPAKDVITWNTMVRGYIHNQLYAVAADLFEEMQAANVKPDFLTMTSVLSACAHLGSLERGTKAHIYAKNQCLDSSPHVTTALIVMYAKCGSILNALEVFYKSQFKDIYCWNATISALSLHGYGSAALELFDKMVESCIMPDDITFIGLLSACSHAGLVEDGCKLFNSMEKAFGITPKREHYGCMVDLLGRAKLLNQAFQLIQAMPFEPGQSILGALLSACVINRDLDTGEKVMKLYFDSTSQLSDGEFMMFANLYASCGKWEEAKMWREKMNDSGIAKTAGCSIVELNGRFHQFLAGEIGIDLKP
ncbi:eukaryotic translation initiation factor isoform 4g-1 [Quercus suber]|uniref:Eukaryotic translation initiation factor isoform 4g-1 n=1 Tax=Quercus suber TaxID=58331 RepID=A0AAW0JJ04_QUESU